ncbi:MAG: ogr/Delta-like zinc finger family protein [Pseudodesulfovibrio sp.]|nr:ogr/Delta-like zinc finger family protein [Pseudodesulfovibrio sp.]
MAFRVHCPSCGKVSVIQSSNEMNPQIKQAYCACSDPECGHTFVVNVEFSHTLSPSAHDLPPDLRKRIRETAPNEQAALFSSAANS